jgi:hypothetical protein
MKTANDFYDRAELLGRLCLRLILSPPRYTTRQTADGGSVYQANLRRRERRIHQYQKERTLCNMIGAHMEFFGTLHDAPHVPAKMKLLHKARYELL